MLIYVFLINKHIQKLEAKYNKFISKLLLLFLHLHNWSPSQQNMILLFGVRY